MVAINLHSQPSEWRWDYSPFHSRVGGNFPLSPLYFASRDALIVWDKEKEHKNLNGEVSTDNRRRPSTGSGSRSWPLSFSCRFRSTFAQSSSRRRMCAAAATGAGSVSRSSPLLLSALTLKSACALVTVPLSHLHNLVPRLCCVQLQHENGFDINIQSYYLLILLNHVNWAVLWKLTK